MAIRTRAELNSIVATNLNTANNTIFAIYLLDYTAYMVINYLNFFNNCLHNYLHGRDYVPPYTTEQRIYANKLFKLIHPSKSLKPLCINCLRGRFAPRSCKLLFYSHY